MKRNVGSMDRILRILVGIGMVGAGVFFQSWWGLIGLVPLTTAFVRWCPAYTFLGLNSCRKCADGEDGGKCAVPG